MADDNEDALIAAHIESSAARSDADSRRLVAALLQRHWPGGSADRSEPGALGWISRWGPASPSLDRLVACSCPLAHCQLCN